MIKKPSLQIMLTLSLLLSVSTPRIAQDSSVTQKTAQDAISVDYEKTSDTTSVVVTTLPVSADIVNGVTIKGINASYYHPGVTLQVPEQVNIGLDVQPCRLLSPAMPYLIIWADGLRYNIGLMNSMFCAGGIGRERQYLRVALPRYTFQQIFKAEKVEVQFGEIKFPMTEKQLEIFRFFTARMNPK